MPSGAPAVWVFLVLVVAWLSGSGFTVMNVPIGGCTAHARVHQGIEASFFEPFSADGSSYLQPPCAATGAPADLGNKSAGRHL